MPNPFSLKMDYIDLFFSLFWQWHIAHSKKRHDACNKEYTKFNQSVIGTILINISLLYNKISINWPFLKWKIYRIKWCSIVFMLTPYIYTYIQEIDECEMEMKRIKTCCIWCVFCIWNSLFNKGFIRLHTWFPFDFLCKSICTSIRKIYFYQHT